MHVMVEYTVQVMIRCILVQLEHIHRRMHHRVQLARQVLHQVAVLPLVMLLLVVEAII